MTSCQRLASKSSFYNSLKKVTWCEGLDIIGDQISYCRTCYDVMDAFGDPIQQTLGTEEPNLVLRLSSWLMWKRQTIELVASQVFMLLCTLLRLIVSICPLAQQLSLGKVLANRNI
jgi:hypothetical protein